MKTRVAIGPTPRRAAWVGYAACAWAFLFAVAHFYWALGGCAGFPVEACEAGLSNPWFLAYDLMAGVLCVLGAATALALVRPWGRIIPRRALLVLALIGGAALLFRGIVGLVQDALILAGPGSGWYPTMLYDPWFLVGGVLFCAAAHRYDRESRRVDPRRAGHQDPGDDLRPHLRTLHQPAAGQAAGAHKEVVGMQSSQHSSRQASGTGQSRRVQRSDFQIDPVNKASKIVSEKSVRTAQDGGRPGVWAAYAACGWAFLFAAPSFYWAAGGTAGIGTLGSSIAAMARDPWFVALVWATGVAKVLAGLFALALVRPWGRRIPRWVLLVGAWGGGLLLVFHGGDLVVQGALALGGFVDVPASVSRAAIRWYTFLWGPWFLVGGLLFCAAA